MNKNERDFGPANILFSGNCAMKIVQSLNKLHICGQDQSNPSHIPLPFSFGKFTTFDLTLMVCIFLPIRFYNNSYLSNTYNKQQMIERTERNSHPH